MAKKPPENDSKAVSAEESSSTQIYIKDDNGEFIPVAIEPLDDSVDNAQTVLVAAQQKFHSGPLPSVEMFKAYGEVVADAPERILCMAEKEQDAAHEFSRTALSHEKTLVSQGQWMGFLAMMVALCGGIYLALNDQVWVAAALVSPAVLTPIMRFYFKGKHEPTQGTSSPPQ